MKNIKKIAVLSFFVIIHSLSNAQSPSSGYYGKYHGAEFQFSGVPSLSRVKKLDVSNGTTISKRRMQLFRMNYRFNYSFLAFRNIEFVLGYEYAKIRTAPNTSFGTGSLEQSLLEDRQFNRHGGDLHVRFYRKGSIAPIGKFIGFGVSYARLSMPDSVQLIVGNFGSATKATSFFNRKNEVSFLDTTALNVPSTHKYTVFNMNLSIGRNYPVTQNLLISVNFRMKLFSLYSSGANFLRGRELSSTSVFNFQGFNQIDIAKSSNPGDINGRTILKSMHRYNRVRLEIGVKYYF